MKSANKLILLFALMAAFLTACEITEEKVELWKGTQNGPKKLAGALIDPDLPINIRAKAGVALVEINQWENFRKAFLKMEKEDSQKTIAAIAPLLGKKAKSENPSEEEQPKKSQVDAKDGLYMMLDFANGESRNAVVKPLVIWCTEGNFNYRAMAGNYRIGAMAKKIGAPAAVGLTKLLTIVPKQIAIKQIADIIRGIKDEKALEGASAQIAKQLKSNVGKFGERQLIAAAVIGGGPVANTFLDLATNNKLSAELQRFALRAFSQALEQKNIKANPKYVERLFEMAENTAYDQYHREETYLTIAQAGGEKEAPRVAKLLHNEEFFWRLVGMRCLLRMDGEKQLEGILTTKKLSKSAIEVKDVIYWAGRFPKLAPQFTKLLQSKNMFAKGVATYVIGDIGKKETDLPILDGLIKSKGKLPKGFLHITIGEAAKAAKEKLAKKE